MRYGLGALAVALVLAAAPASAQRVKVEEASIDQLQAWMASGKASSEAITRAYLDRIAKIDRKGPTLRSVIAVSPNAIQQARASDARRKAGKTLGPLDGVPVLIKDNIETIELPTTAGSLALKDNWTRRDAPLVALLRAKGAVILGKTNLSEWANIRSNDSMSGWSAVGGLVRNPYALDRTSCGSSSGSGAAIAASLAAVAVGTETDGSVVCPASMNGLVGLKPTVGMISRTHVVPISHSQDTPGPMARTVKDAAILYAGMVGKDPADPMTTDAHRNLGDPVAGLSLRALAGRRIGVVRPANMQPALAATYQGALNVLKAQGAELVEVTIPQLPGLGDAEYLVLKTELKADMAKYLATTPESVKVRTLADLIAFNSAHADAEMALFDQSTFLEAEKTKGLDDPEYLEARQKSLKLAAADGLAATMRKNDVGVLVQPSYGMPWLSDAVYGDQFSGPSASRLSAVSGWPHLTVPMGLVKGLPVGLSFIGTSMADGDLLSLGYAYEQAAKARVVPQYRTTVPADLGPRKIIE